MNVRVSRLIHIYKLRKITIFEEANAGIIVNAALLAQSNFKRCTVILLELSAALHYYLTLDCRYDRQKV